MKFKAIDRDGNKLIWSDDKKFLSRLRMLGGGCIVADDDFDDKDYITIKRVGTNEGIFEENSIYLRESAFGEIAVKEHRDKTTIRNLLGSGKECKSNKKFTKQLFEIIVYAKVLLGGQYINITDILYMQYLSIKNTFEEIGNVASSELKIDIEGGDVTYIGIHNVINTSDRCDREYNYEEMHVKGKVSNLYNSINDILNRGYLIRAMFIYAYDGGNNSLAILYIEMKKCKEVYYTDSIKEILNRNCVEIKYHGEV